MANRISDISTVASALSLTDLFELEQAAGPTSAKVTFAVLLAAIKGSAQALGDANAAIANTKCAIGSALTAPRTYTLPAANTLAAGDHVDIADLVGGVSGTHTAVIARAGTDTINGGASYTMASAYANAKFTSDGVSKWSVSAPQQWSSVLDALATSTLSVDGGDLCVATDAAPAAPAAGKFKIYGSSLGGSVLPAVIGPLGYKYELQPFAARSSISWWRPVGGKTNDPLSFGLVPQVVGTETARAPATTNLYASSDRLGITSVTTTGGASELRATSATFWLGNAAGLGGFRLVFRWGAGDGATVASVRSFAGVTSSVSAIGNADPSSLTNMFGVGNDSADTNLQFMHNDGSGTATKVDLGSNFLSASLNADVLELVLFSAPNSGTVYWQVTRLNTGDTVTGNFNSDLPSTTTFLAPHIWRNNASTALAVIVDLFSFYGEKYS